MIHGLPQKKQGTSVTSKFPEDYIFWLLISRVTKRSRELSSNHLKHWYREYSEELGQNSFHLSILHLLTFSFNTGMPRKYAVKLGRTRIFQWISRSTSSAMFGSLGNIISPEEEPKVTNSRSTKKCQVFRRKSTKICRPNLNITFKISKSTYRWSDDVFLAIIHNIIRSSCIVS